MAVSKAAQQEEVVNDGHTAQQKNKHWVITMNDLCGTTQRVFRTAAKHAHRKLQELQRLDDKAELKKLTKQELQNLIGPQQ